MIDMHSHCFPRISREEAFAVDEQRAPWLLVEPGGQRGSIMLGDKPFRPVLPTLWDAPLRLAEMDAQGVEQQIVCATPVMFGYGWPAEKTATWAARMNDHVLAFCASSTSNTPNTANTPARKRFLALSQVPLQSLELACKEATRAQAAGCVGVQIGNHVGDRDLDHETLVDFLIHCAESNIPVLVHPWDMMGAGRMKQWMLPWLVAMPAETQLAMVSLILSGALERIPPSLKICFAHGGGSFAYLLGRVDNAWKHRDVIRKDCPNLPSSYAHRFHVDSAVFEPGALKLLVDVMGVERVMLGSDYPFPLGEQVIGSLVAEAPFLSAQDRQRMVRGNAEAFFNLHPTRVATAGSA